MTQAQDMVNAAAKGALTTLAGAATGTTFTWTYQFAPTTYTKELQVSAAANLRIVEPFVNNAGSTFQLKGTDTFQITTKEGGVWQLKIVSSTGTYQLVAGTDQAKYWSPFPGVDCYPLLINLTGGAGSYTIRYTVSQVQ